MILLLDPLGSITLMLVGVAAVALWVIHGITSCDR